MGRLEAKPTAIGVLHKAYSKLGKQVTAVCKAESAFVFRFHKSTLPPHNVTYTEDDVAKQSKVLCRDFINFKLKQESLLDKAVNKFTKKQQQQEDKTEPAGGGLNAHPTDVSKEIISIATTFEQTYPHLFEDIGTYLKMTYHNANHVLTTYNLAAKEIFNGAITWARVIALFSFTGALTIDCIKRGFGKFANLIVDCFQRFVKKKLASWIVSAGGWPAIVDHFHQYQSPRWRLWAAGSLGTLIGIMLAFIPSETLVFNNF